MHLLIVTSVLLALGLQAEAQMPSGSVAASASPGVPMSNQQGTLPVPSDSQIAEIVKTANNADVDGGKYAQKRAQRQDVKDFAKEMVEDHTAANKKLIQIWKSAKLKKEDSEASKSMKLTAKDSMKKLKDTKKVNFDYEYISAEVSMHQQVLNSLDNDLIPNAKNAELKAYLTDVRGTIAHHLEMATKIQTAINAH